MKTKSIITTLFLLFISIFTYSQTVKPVLTFSDEPLTHNAGIASDGSYLYTINGGVASKGRIAKFSLTGKLIESYSIELDMRGIFYNPRDKKFYVNCYDRNIYKITDMPFGKYELVKSGLYENEQTSLSLSPDGKLLYSFNKGTLNIYKFPKCKQVKTITGLDYGSGHINGESAVTVDKSHIYTWNGEDQLIFIYDLKGKKIKSVNISDGNYGFSLSYANGLIFVAVDGDYDVGTWYGYNLESK